MSEQSMQLFVLVDKVEAQAVKCIERLTTAVSGQLYMPGKSSMIHSKYSTDGHILGAWH